MNGERVRELAMALSSERQLWLYGEPSKYSFWLSEIALANGVVRGEYAGGGKKEFLFSSEEDRLSFEKEAAEFFKENDPEYKPGSYSSRVLYFMHPERHQWPEPRSDGLLCSRVFRTPAGPFDGATYCRVGW